MNSPAPSEKGSIRRDDPLQAAREAARRGIAVVGYTHGGFPRELALACGAWPVLIRPGPHRPVPHADEVIDSSEAWPLRDLADRALSGTLDILSLFVIAGADEWLYYNLKEAVRIGRGASVPPLHLHDFIADTGAAVRGYNLDQWQRLESALSRITGRRPVCADLAAAVEEANRARQMVFRLQAARDAGRLSGATGWAAQTAYHMLDTGAFIDHGQRLLDTAGKDAPKRRLLVVTSEPLFQPHLHRLVEQAGATIAAEDDWMSTRSGELYAGKAEPADLIDHAIRTVQDPRAFPRDLRERWVRARIAAHIDDGVLFYLPPADRSFGWGYPGLRALCEAHGLPHFLLREDTAQCASGPPRSLSNWIASLEQGR